MNKEKVVIISDSTSDIDEELAKKYDIRIMPLRVMYPEKDYEDGVDIDPLTIYNRFPEDIPTTSTPTLEEAHRTLQKAVDDGFEKVIAICISSGISGTFNTVRLAVQDFPQLECFVFDTKSISCGSGVFAIWAATKLEEGMSFADICSGLNEKVFDSKVFYYMDTLKYLQRGGRIGLVASTLGTMLRLKPVISCNKEGIYYTIAKIRGEKNAKSRLVEEVCHMIGSNPAWVVFEHGAAEEEMKLTESMVKAVCPNIKTIYRRQINASNAVHTGPGLVGIGVFINP